MTFENNNKPLAPRLMIKHLAGIIPIAESISRFKMPWHDVLMPLGENYFLIHKSIYDCALAGCETIWLVCPRDIEPLLRKIVGDFIEDPVYHLRFHAPKEKRHEQKKFIPIYYVPIAPKDYKRRESLIWSLIYGAFVANSISTSISGWLKPESFFITFPFNIIHSDSILRKNRILLSSNKKVLFVNDKNHSILDGEYFPFVCSMKDIRFARKKFHRISTREIDKFSDKKGEVVFINDKGYEFQKMNKLPRPERWSGRWLEPKDVLEFNMEDVVRLPIEDFSRILSWTDYQACLSNFTFDRPELFNFGGQLQKIAAD